MRHLLPSKHLVSHLVKKDKNIVFKTKNPSRAASVYKSTFTLEIRKSGVSSFTCFLYQSLVSFFNILCLVPDRIFSRFLFKSFQTDKLPRKRCIYLGFKSGYSYCPWRSPLCFLYKIGPTSKGEKSQERQVRKKDK